MSAWLDGGGNDEGLAQRTMQNELLVCDDLDFDLNGSTHFMRGLCKFETFRLGYILVGPVQKSVSVESGHLDLVH